MDFFKKMYIMKLFLNCNKDCGISSCFFLNMTDTHWTQLVFVGQCPLVDQDLLFSGGTTVAHSVRRSSSGRRYSHCLGRSLYVAWTLSSFSFSNFILGTVVLRRLFHRGSSLIFFHRYIVSQPSLCIRALGGLKINQLIIRWCLSFNYRVPSPQLIYWYYRVFWHEWVRAQCMRCLPFRATWSFILAFFKLFCVWFTGSLGVSLD